MGKLKFALFIFYFTCCTFFVHAQDNGVLKFQLVKSIVGNFSQFSTDNLGNFYTLNQDKNQITKYNNHGDSLAAFDNVRKYGNIYSFDVSNPLKILVYYKDFATVVVLDRFFNTVNTVDLRQSGILQAQAITTSYDNLIWLYDQQAAKIDKIDAQGNTVFSSTDLRTVFSDVPDPEKIIDNNGLLYLYDKQLGWFEFDYYGAFKRQLPYKNWSDVSVVNTILFGREGDSLWIFNPKKFDAEAIPVSTELNLSAAKQMKMLGDKMYLLDKNGVEEYTVSQ